MDAAIALAFALQQAWEAPAHAAATPWWFRYCDISRILVVSILVVLLVRAVARRRRYSALEQLRTRDVEDLVEMVRVAERRSTGELIVVVLERSDRYPGANWLAAFVFFVAGTATSMPWLPWHDPVLTLATQIAFFALGFALTALLPDFKRFFVSAARATEMAQEQAMQEFQRHRLHETKDKTGVLVFVSLFERAAIVLGDTGVSDKVDATAWQAVSDALLAGLRGGSLKKGLSDAVRIASDVLAINFPGNREGRDELPNLVIVRRE